MKNIIPMNLQTFASEENLTTTDDLGGALSVDFVEQFNLRLKSFFELLGIERRIPVSKGTVIQTYKATTTLDGTAVEPGDIIPLSKVELKKDKTYTIAWDKKRKATPAETIQDVGFDRAVTQTDAAFVREIQKGIRTKFLEQLATGTGTSTGEGLQKALANAWGKVVSAFEEDDVDAIAFINPMDAADYLGSANLTTQTAFGMNYLENFLNFRIVFMHPSITQGTLYATAAQNLVMYYVNMNGELDRAFDFTTDQSGIIGVTHDINKQRLTAETITAYGIALFAEVLNGVVKGTITAPDITP